MGAIAKATIKSLKNFIDKETDFDTSLTEFNKLLEKKFASIGTANRISPIERDLKKEAVKYFKDLRKYRANQEIEEYQFGDIDIPLEARDAPPKFPSSAGAIIKKTPNKAILFAIRKRLSKSKPSEVAKGVFEKYKKTSVGEGKAYKTENEFKEVIKQTIKNVQKASIAKKKGPRQLDLEDQIKANEKKFALSVPEGSKAKKVVDKDIKKASTNKTRLKDKLANNKKKIAAGVLGGGTLVTGSIMSLRTNTDDKKIVKAEKVKPSNEKKKTTTTGRSSKAQSSGGTRKPTDRRTMGESKRKVKKDKSKDNKSKTKQKKVSKYDAYIVYDPSFLGVRSRKKKKR